jgi:hypothetical protein
VIFEGVYRDIGFCVRQSKSRIGAHPPSHLTYSTMSTCRGSYEGDDVYRTARQLCAMQPWSISLDDCHVSFLFHDVPAQQMCWALNAMLVGLLVGPSPGCGGMSPGAVSCVTTQSDEDMARLLPCMGVGLVRAVDMKQRRLYLLTDVSQEDLERVTVLQVSNALLCPRTYTHTYIHTHTHMHTHTYTRACANACMKNACMKKNMDARMHTYIHAHMCSQSTHVGLSPTQCAPPLLLPSGGSSGAAWSAGEQWRHRPALPGTVQPQPRGHRGGGHQE